MSKEEVIPAHKDSWSNRELLQRVLSRYCYVLEDIGGRTPTYLVSEKEDEDMHEVLDSINKHLSKLGFSARLYPDEPWILQLIPDPIRQWPSPRFVLSMWLLSLLTTIFAGERWMDSARPDGGWFVSNNSLDALIGYSLPLFGTIMVASFVQKRIAAGRGVNVPHIFPIPGPAMLWWPFGILGFASLPRSDARLWPDRSSLGNSALSVPIIMILAGMIFALLGLKMTPDIVPLTASPLAVELPLLINLIGLSMEGEIAMILKTSWAHPFTRVGMTLTFVGWVSLLPIPTFPGGRILIARMGIPEARSGSTQIMLLMVVLLFAFLFGAFSSWSIWVPIVALCASLLITKGSDPRLPIVLDDFKGLPDSDHRRIGVILFMAFMLALPAQIPFAESEDWDEGITWIIGEDKLVIEDGWFNQSLTVSNPSLIVQDWKITYLGTTFGSSNLTEIDCKSGTMDSVNSCSGTVDPLDEIKLSFNFEWLEDWNTTSVDLLWQIDDYIIQHSVVPDQSYYPIGSWEFNGDLDDPKSCIELKVKGEETISLSQISNHSLWENIDDEGNVTVDEGNSEICLDALSGDDMSWLEGHLFFLGNVSYKAGYYQEQIVAIPEDGVMLNDQELMFSRSILAMNHEGDCLELGTPSPPLTDEDGNRTWNMSISPLGMNSIQNSSDPIHFFAPADSIITDCNSMHSPNRYTVQRGPSLIIGIEDERTQHWANASVDIIDDYFVIENPGSKNISLNIEFDGNGSQWVISNNIVLQPGQVTNVSAISPENGISFAWLELNDGDVILHLVNHEA